VSTPPSVVAVKEQNNVAADMECDGECISDARAYTRVAANSFRPVAGRYFRLERSKLDEPGIALEAIYEIDS